MTDRIERELLIDGTPEEIWELVTAPGWLADEVALDLRPGGDAHFVSEGSVKTGWVEEVLPPRRIDGDGRLAFWWASDGEPATRVEVAIESVGWAGSRVRVVETRPLDVLDLVGTPLGGLGGASYGPALVAA